VAGREGGHHPEAVADDLAQVLAHGQPLLPAVLEDQQAGVVLTQGEGEVGTFGGARGRAEPARQRVLEGGEECRRSGKHCLWRGSIFHRAIIPDGSYHP
jgi:hypothetical protein